MNSEWTNQLDPLINGVAGGRAEESRELPGRASSQPLRLLVVEDSQADAVLLLHALRRGGYVHIEHAIVETATALRAALQLQDWDVITSDNSMPALNAAQVRSLAAELRPDVPLIIVSGEIDLDLAVSLMKAGARDYVPKKELGRLAASVDHNLREAQVLRDRQRAIQALQISETRYRRLFETAQDGILIIDADTAQIADVNPFLIAMLGYSKEEFLGKKLWEIGAFGDVEASKRAFSELQTAGYVRYEDLPLEARGGRRVDVEFVSNSYLVNQKKVVQCNIRDITERKQAQRDLRALTAQLEQRVSQRTEQLESLNRELEAFSYSVSHDLHAPLRQIEGFARILQEECLVQANPSALDTIQRMRAAAARMGAIIDALLSLARLSAGDLERVCVNVTALAYLIAEELHQDEASRHVEWVIVEGATAKADAQLLRVVLVNLLGNAWKFTAKRACAHIEFGAVRQGDGSMGYFVRDDGAGFDSARASCLFGAFQRLHSGEQFSGMGIGLATVQRIIHRHGGRVWAEGAVDEGATFWFTLGVDA